MGTEAHSVFITDLWVEAYRTDSRPVNYQTAKFMSSAYNEIFKGSPSSRELVKGFCFDQFQIRHQLSANLAGINSSIVKQTRTEYSAFKLGCRRACQQLAKGIAAQVHSSGLTTRCPDLLVAVPPTFADPKFLSAQQILVRAVAKELGQLDFVDWGLKLRGDIGKSYAQHTEPDQRAALVSDSIRRSSLTISCEGRDVLVVDDVWVTGMSAGVTGKHFRSSGARTVSYAGFAALGTDNPACEHLLNCYLIHSRNWQRLEEIFTQKDPPSRHLFNALFEDPVNWQVFTADCPPHIRSGLIAWAEIYYEGKTASEKLKSNELFPYLG